MPRQPKPWFRSNPPSWYTTVNGKQHWLLDGDNSRESRDLAYAEFYKLQDWR